jgi:hypothetical protein
VGKPASGRNRVKNNVGNLEYDFPCFLILFEVSSWNFRIWIRFPISSKFRSRSLDMPHLLWKPKNHYLLRNIPLVNPNFSQMYLVCRFADSLRAGSWSCSQAVCKPVWHVPLLCVQWKTPDDGQRNCPKHVECHSKYKFEKLVYLVSFIIRNLEIYLFFNVNIFQKSGVKWVRTDIWVFIPPGTHAGTSSHCLCCIYLECQPTVCCWRCLSGQMC